jgi:hypothetical protein
MWIPELYDAYNHNMGAVDVADQLQGQNGGLRRIKRGATQAVDQFLLQTVLVNCYLLSLYAKWEGGERVVKHRSQDDFRINLVEALLAAKRNAKGPGKRVYPFTNSEGLEVPLHYHEHVKMPTRKDCYACKGVRHQDRPLKRVALGVIAANEGRSTQRRTSWYGYKQCKVALCKEGGCFERYHRN